MGPVLFMYFHDLHVCLPPFVSPLLLQVFPAAVGKACVEPVFFVYFLCSPAFLALVAYLRLF